MTALALILALGAGAPAWLPEPPDVASFLYPGRSPGVAVRDGSTATEWDGPGQPQFRLSLPFLRRRNEELGNAEMMFQSLMQAVKAFYDATGDQTPTAVRQQLTRMAGPSLDEARGALLEAVELEHKRLIMLRKAVQLAAEQDAAPSTLDRDLIERRTKAIVAGQLVEAVEARVRAHRNLALGLVAYIDGDQLGALEKMKAASRDGPEIVMAHVYLGSLYYLFQQVDPALAEWKKALDIDPSNEAVRQAIKQHSSERRR